MTTKTKKQTKRKEHPAVKLAREYLRDYKALSAVSKDFCLPTNGLIALLNNIIEAK